MQRRTFGPTSADVQLVAPALDYVTTPPNATGSAFAALFGLSALGLSLAPFLASARLTRATASNPALETLMGGSIADVPGITVGHHTLTRPPTGCTVLLCEEGAVAGVDVRGSAPGTRETDLLDPTNLVQKVQPFFCPAAAPTASTPRRG
jgi:hypothetical protein